MIAAALDGRPLLSGINEPIDGNRDAGETDHAPAAFFAITLR